ncbi:MULTISPECIES: hypothetical protein [Streptomyces]|nr:hypothetical protein [Streptomyces sp. SID724]
MPAHPGISVLLLAVVTGLSLVGGEAEDRTAGLPGGPGRLRGVLELGS